MLLCMSLLSACSSTPLSNNERPAVVTADGHHTPETHAPESANNTSNNRDQETSAANPAESMNESPSPEPSQQSLGEEAALRAIALVGKPYRYGGADLDGFDCSGLVFYIYHELGIEVPRTAAAQRHASTHVSRNDLLPGDLVFFHTNRRRISHVGIYVGDNRFVHAPQSGKYIELRGLDEEYFAKRWVGTGRIK